MNSGVILGFIIGFIIFSIITTRGEGKEPLIFSNFIILGIHLHHWRIFTIMIMITIPIIMVYGYNNIGGGVLGFCLGSILQGLTFNDAFKM
jgi:hypothetical protein